MPQPDQSALEPRHALHALRVEIDRIDDALLQLIEERLRLARAIADQKDRDDNDSLRLRPARERAIVARLASRATHLPRAAIEAIWRELMGASLQTQRATRIAICCPQQPVLITDQVRQRFGGAAPIVVAETPQDALDSARKRQSIAIIELTPLSNWWVELFHDDSLAIFDCVRDRQGRIVALAIGRIAAPDPAAELAVLVLGDAALRRRTTAGENVRTLAMCGNLRLCATQAGGEPRPDGEAAR